MSTTSFHVDADHDLQLRGPPCSLADLQLVTHTDGGPVIHQLLVPPGLLVEFHALLCKLDQVIGRVIEQSDTVRISQ